MNIERAKELLKGFNDGYTFQGCETCFKFNEKDSCCNKEKCEELEAIETVLSELEKKDKVINEMSNFINLMGNELVAETGDNNLEFCKRQKCIDNGELDCEECIKEYFTNKVEREGK